jgi:triosephosphate isomerase
MRQLIAGNWKMNGLLAQLDSIAAPLTKAHHAADVLICTPATLLHPARALLAESSVLLGAQDCHAKASGAHTGDLSAAMLHDAGARYVILGHSERRADHGETDAIVLAKVQAARAAGLTPIVCVGESEAQRLADMQDKVVGAQLRHSLPAGFDGVIAYEPIWAIGTGRTPTEQDVAAMHAHIRATLVAHLGAVGQGLRILYGGSVKPSNAKALLALPEVGGALVGGASLVAEDFLAVVRGAAG